MKPRIEHFQIKYFLDRLLPEGTFEQKKEKALAISETNCSVEQFLRIEKESEEKIERNIIL